MTSLLRVLRPALILCLMPVLAAGQESPDYDRLLADLAAADSPAEADGLVPQIWNLWLTAPDETAQEVLDAALERRQSRDFVGALAQLDRLVRDYPDYAEGWNQRATVHFMIGDYAASLVDVRETLAREPRHFGALAGQAMIYYRQGKLPLAQIAVRKALAFHPFLAERAILDIPAGTDI